VAGNADPMLGYMTTSFRDHPFLRGRVARRMTSAMEQRLVALTACTSDGASRAGAATIARLAAPLGLDGWRALVELQERGLDIGLEASWPDARVEAIYANAQRALYATIAEAVIRDASPLHLRTRSTATSRDDYLAHPSAGERLREEDGRAVASLAREKSAQVQIVVSDGLNANAVNEHLREVLPQVRRLLSSDGRHVATTDVVVQNGRVRVGYQIGGLLSADLLVHFIGERPGTGLNTLSAYLTYGRDAAGQLRWTRNLDHSVTTAICGIHPKGKPPQEAAREIARTVRRILEQRRSGVGLTANQG